MVRGRGKAKKLTVNNNEDRETGEDEKIPSQKQRGRPEKPLKDEIEELEKAEDEDEDSENAIANDIASKKMRISSAEKNNKKRKRNLQSKESADSADEKNGNNSSKSGGFRHNGSRRKNKPCRAAEAGVICR